MAEAIATVVSATPEPATPPAAARDAGATDNGQDSGFSFPQALSRRLDEGAPATAAGKPAAGPVADEVPANGKNLPPDSAVLAALLLAPVEPAGVVEPVAAPTTDATATDPTAAALLAALLPPARTPGAVAAAANAEPAVIVTRPSASRVLTVDRAGGNVPDLGTESAELFGAGLTAAPDGEFDPAQLLAGAAGGGERADAAASRLLAAGNEQSIRPAGLTTVATGAAPAESAGRAAAAIPVPVAHPDWGNELGQRVLWMTNQQLSGAELRLSPPELGPLSVQISMDNDQASIQFSAHQSLVREAIESALPRLREMLAGAGINLADVSVSQHGFTQAQQDRGDAPAGTRGEGDGGLETLPVPPRMMLGLVDLYA